MIHTFIYLKDFKKSLLMFRKFVRLDIIINSKLFALDTFHKCVQVFKEYGKKWKYIGVIE